MPTRREIAEARLNEGRNDEGTTETAGGSVPNRLRKSKVHSFTLSPNAEMALGKLADRYAGKSSSAILEMALASLLASTERGM